MVRYCGVKNCRNNDKDNADLYFHVLPSKPENIREEWLRRIRKNGDMPKRLNVCSEHFEPECYERDLQSELLGTSPKPRLKPNAVPSIFLDQKPVKRRLTSEKRTTEISTTIENPDITDISYTPSLNSSIVCCEDDNHFESDKKFIVYWSELRKLFKTCLKCGGKAMVNKCSTYGSMLKVEMKCDLGHSTVWDSQPLVGNMASGNLSLCSSVLLTGNTFTHISEFFDLLKTPFVGESSYYKIQKSILFPVINDFYTTACLKLKDEVHQIGKKVDLIGDGRCDSPGFNAKYGTYTFMLADNRVVDFTNVHVAEVKHSTAMEKEGLIRTINKVESSEINIDTITTDRHTQIRAYLAKERPDIIHQFDIWHFSKSIKKKITKKSKKYPNLQKWIPSIITHFWWSCQTCNEDAILLREKWKSVLYHVKNKHGWKSDKEFTKFKRCAHKRLCSNTQHDVQWLKESSPEYKALEEVVLDRTILKDMQLLTLYKHTGMLEVFNGLLNKYCPKREHFSYLGMIARHQLAILDHNANVNRKQARTKTGELRYKYQSSKVTNQWSAKPILERKDRAYLDQILAEIFETKRSSTSYSLPVTPVLPQNLAIHNMPSKDELRSLRSRFRT